MKTETKITLTSLEVAEIIKDHLRAKNIHVWGEIDFRCTTETLGHGASEVMRWVFERAIVTTDSK